MAILKKVNRRPYNIGGHKDVKYEVQMKDYFPELVSYIDSTYRTLNDRNYRGIIGFSMGGIMSFFLAGKYPHRVCAAVDLAGSPEFFIGYPDNHTLYPLRYTFRNLMEVNTRQHSGDSDILVYLNQEVKKGAEWEGNPYEFYGFKGGHMIDKPGETKAFEMAMRFVTEQFGQHKAEPVIWSHYDIYSRFNVWDYQVSSNKQVPGFIFLSDVSKGGLGLYTHRWLPDGPSIRGIEAEITTAPLYKAGKTYYTAKWVASRNRVETGRVTADAQGRIYLVAEGTGCETGIYDDQSKPDIITLAFFLNDSDRLLRTGEPNRLIIELFNRGGEVREKKKLRITIKTADSTVTLTDSVQDAWIDKSERLVKSAPFVLSCDKLPPEHGEPFQIRLQIKVETDDTVSVDEIIIPVLFDAAAFRNVVIDDGIEIKDRAFGSGNHDGVADAGERLLLYEGNRRLRLYTNDPWVDGSKEELFDEQLPAIWEDGFTLSSIIYIKDDCPDGHVIEFTGSYETNTWNPVERNLHWGKVFVAVRNHKNK